MCYIYSSQKKEIKMVIQQQELESQTNTLWLTTVFIDTRPWKTKHPRKHFQNFCQPYVLSTEGIEIHHHSHQCDLQTFFTSCQQAVIGGFRSDLSVTCMIDGNFGNVSAGVLFSKVAYQRNENGVKGQSCNFFQFLFLNSQKRIRYKGNNKQIQKFFLKVLEPLSVVSKQADDHQSSAGYLIVCRRLLWS